MSDSDTSDSDSGIRFKTASTRYKSDGADKYGSSAKSNRSLDTSSRSGTNRRRSRSRDRDRRRSKSRSHSRDRRRRRDDRRQRSRTPSRSKRSSRDRRDHRSKSNSRTSSGHSSSVKEVIPVVEPTKVEPTKVLDISVSSLSSQDEHLGREEAPDDHFGPALPPSMQSNSSERLCKESVEEETTDVLGPALPPHLMAQKQQEEPRSPEQSKPSIGPALPPEGYQPPKNTAGDSSESELSPFSEEEPADENDDCIGPMPGASSSKSQLELEKRALEMKLRRLDGDGHDSKAANASAREDWMLELPDIRKVSDMGLGARQFRTREKQEIGDRSVWTDTPSDKDRKKNSGHSSRDAKQDHEQEQERLRIAERDKQQEDQIKRHKKKHKRDKSLLDLHQKKLKKEKKDDDEPTRRPFDRNVDLHANRFDDAQKKAIMKKAQLLDTRFSSGASKFL